jgi:hypothetical protein
MGFGDVLLARAMGAMLASVVPAGMAPLRLVPAWVSLSIVSGVIVGSVMLWHRGRESAATEKDLKKNPVDSPLEPEDLEEQPVDGSNMVQQVLEVAGCLVLLDMVEELRAAVRSLRGADPSPEEEQLVEFGPMAPTAIPFGPFLVIGFLGAVFCGEWMTAAYLAYALPKPKPDL